MPQLDLYIWLVNSNLFFAFFVFFYFYVIIYLLVPLCKLFYIRKFFSNMINFSEMYIEKHLHFINAGFFSMQMVALFNKLNNFLKKKSAVLRLYVKYKFVMDFISKNTYINNYVFYMVRADYLNFLKRNKRIVN
jgi:hypothetical protein